MKAIMIIVAHNNKMAIASAVTILMLWIMTLSFGNALAQDGSDLPDKLLVGMMDTPPFSIKTADNRWEGLSIELWQAVAKELGVAYELREYKSIKELVDAINRGEVNLTPTVAVTEQREIIMDLSHSFLRSGSTIAFPAEGSGAGFFRIAEHLASWILLKVIGTLIALWLIAGLIVWLFERRRNPEMFGGGIVKGLGHGIWWAAVTMTTVGYGDKTPRTLGGRMVALAWMLASILLISSFTASITASLTVGELSGKVQGFRDLPGVRVGSVSNSETFKLLAERGIAALPFVNERNGLQAIIDNKIDAFVYNEIVLKHLVKTEFPALIHVLPGTFDHYYVSMAMTTGSPLREPLNRALLKIMGKDEWIRLVERYIGSN